MLACISRHKTDKMFYLHQVLWRFFLQSFLIVAQIWCSSDVPWTRDFSCIHFCPITNEGEEEIFPDCWHFLRHRVAAYVFLGKGKMYFDDRLSFCVWDLDEGPREGRSFWTSGLPHLHYLAAVGELVSRGSAIHVLELTFCCATCSASTKTSSLFADITRCTSEGSKVDLQTHTYYLMVELHIFGNHALHLRQQLIFLRSFSLILPVHIDLFSFQDFLCVWKTSTDLKQVE